MALRLITGGPHAGKSGLLYDAVVDAVASNRSPVVVFPTAPDARRAQVELAERACVGVRVAVLDSWIAELWSIYGDGRRIASEASRATLLDSAVAKTPLSVLADSARTPGFVRYVSQVLSSVAIGEARAGEARARRPDVADEEREILEISRHYLDLLRAHGLIEPAEAAWLLGTSPPAHLRGPVAVNRFAELSPAQERFLCGIALVADVIVTLPWVKGRASTDAITPLVERLERIGSHEVLDERPESGDALDLEGLLFTAKHGPVEKPRVSFVEAKGEEAECFAVAETCRALIEEGVSPGRIAVAFRAPAKRRAILEAALSGSGVPATLDIVVPFSETGFGTAVCSLLDIVSRRDVSRERLTSFLLSPYSGADHERVAALDLRWRKSRAEYAEMLDGSRLLGERCGRLFRLAGLVTSSGVGESTGKWQELADAVLDCSTADASTPGARTLADFAAHRALLTMVSEVAVSGVQTPEDEFTGAMARTPVATAVGIDTGDRVQVTEAHRLQGRRFDAVVLGGLSASEFSSHSGETATDALVTRMLGHPPLDPALRERMLFYSVVTRARSRLVLIRQACDSEGRDLLPSPFWLEVARVCAGPGDPEVPARPASLSEVEVSPERVTESFAPPGGRVRVPSRRPEHGVLADPDALSALAMSDELSVSEIESYLSCPYRWFVERVVRPRQIDGEVGVRERGARAHELLARFYQRWVELGHSRVDANNLCDAVSVLEGILAEDGAALRHAARGIEEEALLEEAITWTRAIVCDDATLMPSMSPVAHEFRFGAAHERPFSFGGVRVRGSIDRVDQGHSGVFVTDYKGARVVKGKGSFATEGLIQVPLYAAAAGELLDAEVLGGAYRSLSTLSMRGFWRSGSIDLDDRGSKADGLDAAGIREVIEAAETRVAEAVDGIRAGRIEPAKGKGCTYCSIKATCPESGTS